MKKSILFLFTLMSFVFTNSSVSKAQAVEKGDIIIDGYYGWPNLWSGILKAFYVTDLGTGESNVEVKSFGPAGGRFEYMVTEQFGIGLDVSYANSAITWGDSVLNSETWLNEYETYKVSVPRFRIVPRFNYHFEQSEKIDLYGVFGIGYNGISYKFETSDDFWDHIEAKNLVPISYRLAVGVRFFMSDNIGINFEAGIGGPLLTGGISVKL